MTDSALLIRFTGLIRSGIPIESALTIIGGLPEDKDLRFILSVSKETGSAVAGELNMVADLFSFRERSLQRVKIAQSAPLASAKLVIWLPLITLGLAQIVGLDILGAMLNRPVLLYSVSFGFLLLGLAKLISRKMISNAKPVPNPTGMYLLGVALAGSGGVSFHRAQNLALQIYREVYQSEPSDTEFTALAQVTTLLEQTGSKTGELLRSQAEVLQREILTESEIVIERLGVKLMLPLGLAVLPAFVLITVVPLLVSMVSPI